MPNLPTLALLLALAPAPGAAPDGPGDPELPLADGLALLESQNLTVAQARARAAEAAALAREAVAPLLPTLTAQGSWTKNRDEAKITPPAPPGVTVEPIFIQPFEQLTATGSARLPLLVPSAWFDLGAARGAARAADASAEATRRAVRTGFAQAAHAAVAAEEVVTASRQAADSAAELARSARRRVAAGTAAPLEALRAETEQVRRESDLVRARAELARSRLALGVLLGRDGPVRIAVPAEPAAVETPPPDALVAEALSSRPELVAQAAQVDAAEAAVRSAWARLAPQLSASAAIFASDVPYPTREKDGWRTTVDLVWPLYDGGFRYGKRREAEARLDGARAAASAERLAVSQQARDGARDLEVARERFRLAETQRRLAADAAASARRSFEAGVASSLDVIDSNDRLYVADVGLADARARLAQARLGLERALGR